MRDLFQLPVLSPKAAIQKRPASTPDLSTLKGRQREVFDGIIGHLTNNSSSGIVVLEGVAGSGKTYIVSRIIEQYLSDKPYNKVCFASTTNRSLEISFKLTEFTHPSLRFHTIHKLLALKETMLEDGSMDFFPDKFITPSITEFNVVFVDESSQFSRKLWAYLAPYIDGGLKVVMVGDNFQVNPVKEADSIVFNRKWQVDNNAALYQLTEIVRQAKDNPIITVASFIREHIHEHIHLSQKFDYRDMRWNGDFGVEFIRSNKQSDNEYLDALLMHIFKSGNFNADAACGKCVAWRNKTVAILNASIRRMIYGKGKLRRIEPMEKIISKQPIFEGEMIIINSGKMMEVVDFTRQEEIINEGQFKLPYYDTKVKLHDMYGNEVFYNINIPTDLGMKVYMEVLELLAKNAKSYRQGTFAFKAAWGDFYKFQKLYANILHDYAGNIHTSQGSTFNNTIVFARDIMANPKVTERNRILYTGCTRSSERLFII